MSSAKKLKVQRMKSARLQSRKLHDRFFTRHVKETQVTATRQIGRRPVKMLHELETANYVAVCLIE